MSDITVHLKWNPSAQTKLEEAPDNILYESANVFKRATYSVTPMRTGKLRSSANRYGVQKVGAHTYQIANTMRYAASTYRGFYLSPSGRSYEIHNWTTPGTNKAWYENTLRTKGRTLFMGVIAKHSRSFK